MGWLLAAGRGTSSTTAGHMAPHSRPLVNDDCTLVRLNSFARYHVEAFDIGVAAGYVLLLCVLRCEVPHMAALIRGRLGPLGGRRGALPTDLRQIQAASPEPPQGPDRAVDPRPRATVEDLLDPMGLRAPRAAAPRHTRERSQMVALPRNFPCSMSLVLSPGKSRGLG